MLKSFPCSLVVKGRDCWVIGADREGVDKALKLAKAGAEVVVVAENVSAGAKKAFRDAGIALEERPFQLEDLNDQFLVVFELNQDLALTKEVAERCRKKKILLSAIDRAEFCDVSNVSVYEREALRIAVSTEGVAPALARKIREGLESSLKLVPIEQFMQELSDLRESVKNISDAAERRRRLIEAVEAVRFEARLTLPKRISK
jgi:siroheme synthase-like protein